MRKTVVMLEITLNELVVLNVVKLVPWLSKY